MKMYNDVVIFEKKYAIEFGLIESILIFEISNSLRRDEANKRQVVINNDIYTKFNFNMFLEFITEKQILKSLKKLENKKVIKTLKNDDVYLVQFYNGG
jgi:hypothetical protein